MGGARALHLFANCSQLSSRCRRKRCDVLVDGLRRYRRAVFHTSSSRSRSVAQFDASLLQCRLQIARACKSNDCATTATAPSRRRFCANQSNVRAAPGRTNLITSIRCPQAAPQLVSKIAVGPNAREIVGDNQRANRAGEPDSHSGPATGRAEFPTGADGSTVRTTAATPRRACAWRSFSMRERTMPRRSVYRAHLNLRKEQSSSVIPSPIRAFVHPGYVLQLRTKFSCTRRRSPHRAQTQGPGPLP